VEPFRYFLMREMTFGLDSNFSEELLVERYNADLANDLGNLFSRVLSLLHKYRGGQVPEAEAAVREEDGQYDPDAPWESCRGILSWARDEAARYEQDMNGFAFHKALFTVWEIIGAANKFVVTHEPWSLAKDPAKSEDLDKVLFTLAQLLADIAVLVWPVMPETAEKMAGVLGLHFIKPGMLEQIQASQLLLPPGTQTHRPPALFPRIDTAKVKAKAAKAEQKAETKPAPEPPAEISIEQFAQVQLKVATVLKAEAIPKADKLLKLTLDAGEPEPRIVVAGVAQHYAPEELKGKQVVIVANLKPAKLRGVTSQGMVLAAVDGKELCLVSPTKESAPGSVVR